MMNVLIWCVAIGGSLVGIAGGALGTWVAIRNTRTPQERRFMIACSVATWAAVGLFVLAMIFIPVPYRYFLWVPYLVAMLVAIPWMNRVQARLRNSAASKS